MKRLVLLLLLLLLASPAFAAVPEKCGDGIDNSFETGGAAAGTYGSCPAGYHNSVLGTGHGCDADCPGVDKDNDGYTSDGSVGWRGSTSKDCDDGDMWDYPGTYVPTSFPVTGYKLCNADGTFGSTTLTAVTPLCEAPGGTNHCWYVDCGNSLGTATDVNAGHVYSLPKLTRGSILSSVGTDDFVYFIGTGTCTETSTLTVAGTSGHPITWKNYPGATAKQDSTGTTFKVNTSVPFNVFDNIDGNGLNYIIDSSSDDTTVTRSYLHDLYGDSHNNAACFRSQATNRQKLYGNIFRDCLGDPVASSGNIQNVAAVTILDTDGPTVGQDHEVIGDTCFFSAPDATTDNMCLHIKHGVTAAHAGTNGFQVKWNSFSNYLFRGASLGTSKLRVYANWFYAGADDASAWFLGDIGGSVANQDEQIRYNVIARGNVGWVPLYAGSETLAFDHNILIDPRSSYGDCAGLLRMDAYGSDAQLALFAAGYLNSDFNCYYSPNTTEQFCFFGETAGGHGPAGPGGGQYTFSGWKATPGYDIDSTLGNPGTSSPLYQGTGACAAYGPVGSTTTTTTTTTISTTTTTTLAPYLGPVSAFRRFLGGRL